MKELTVGDWSLQTWDFPYSLCKVFFTLKKSVFSQTPQKGSVGVKKLLNELKCRMKLIFQTTKPKKVLHLDTLSEPSPQNLFKFSTKPKKVL